VLLALAVLELAVLPVLPLDMPPSAPLPPLALLSVLAELALLVPMLAELVLETLLALAPASAGASRPPSPLRLEDDAASWRAPSRPVVTSACPRGASGPPS
jgi:hypothetical protein